MLTSPSMQGKIVLITGASSGIGKETARIMAGLGAIIVIVGRNREKTSAAAREIQSETGNPQVGYLIADLTSQVEVRRMAKEYLGHTGRLDVLINNAGALFANHQLSADGREMTLALNHLAPFLLTYQLIDALHASPSARVINVSSEAHRGYHLNFNDLNNEQGYSAWKAYGQSKLANIYFTYGLAAYLEGGSITANCLHPGFVATNFGRSNGGVFNPMYRLAHLAAISPRVSAQDIVRLACSPELEGVTAGYFNRSRQERSSEISYDMNIAKQLWDASLELTGLAEPAEPIKLMGSRQPPGTGKYRPT